MKKDCHLHTIHRNKQVGSSNKHHVNLQSSCIIRNRYLSALGFDTSRNVHIGKFHHSDGENGTKTRMFEEPMKMEDARSSMDHVQNIVVHPSAVNYEHQAKLITNGSSRRKYSVSFQPEVSVCLIPSRHSYPTRVKKHLWPDSIELSGNTQRNLIEFAFENNDWRQVIEEDRFYLCKTTGERVHPVHYARLLLQRQCPYFSNVPSVLKKSVVQYSNIASIHWVNHK